MAGLGRVQQRFNLALVAALAAVVRFARGGSEDAKEQAAVGFGHPIHRKYLKGKMDGCPAGFHLTHRAHCVRYVGGPQ